MLRRKDCDPIIPQMSQNSFKCEGSKSNINAKYTRIDKSISWFLEKEKLDKPLANSLIFKKEDIKHKI